MAPRDQFVSPPTGFPGLGELPLFNEDHQQLDVDSGVSRVLVIYTGGTIGMTRTSKVGGELLIYLFSVVFINLQGTLIHIYIYIRNVYRRFNR